MKYITINEISKKWGVSERSARNYCASGRVVGAYLEGKTWMIPIDAVKPARQIRHAIKIRNLLDTLKDEKNSSLKGGIYHKLQVEMTYLPIIQITLREVNLLMTKLGLFTRLKRLACKIVR